MVQVTMFCLHTVSQSSCTGHSGLSVCLCHTKLQIPHPLAADTSFNNFFFSVSLFAYLNASTPPLLILWLHLPNWCLSWQHTKFPSTTISPLKIKIKTSIQFAPYYDIEFAKGRVWRQGKSLNFSTDNSNKVNKLIFINKKMIWNTSKK